MNLRTLSTLLVCLVFLVTLFVGSASAWHFQQAAFADNREDVLAPQATQTPQQFSAKHIVKVKPASNMRPIVKVKPITKVRHIVKCRPVQGYGALSQVLGIRPLCRLPIPRKRGWELDAEALFARTKGKVRYARGTFGTFAFQSQRDVDLNGDMGLPDHATVGTFSAAYRFRPRWAFRYSIMPLVMNGGGQVNSSFTFGNTQYTSGTNTRVKWERLYQRMGIVYDPIRTYSSRVSIFGEYVRIDDKLSLVNAGFSGDTMNNDLNMAMAGLEFEKCLKTTRFLSTLSLECKAGVSFLDDAVGADLSTGLKYSIPLNSGRWGYLKGGYRYLTYKKGYSDVRLVDTTLEGGFVQAGLVF